MTDTTNAAATTRCWEPYDPESAIGEFGWMWIWERNGESRWRLVATVEAEPMEESDRIETPAIYTRIIDTGEELHDDELLDADQHIGAPYVAASAPTIEPGLCDGVQVRIRLPGGGSLTHALPPSYDASELSRRIAALIREMGDE